MKIRDLLAALPALQKLGGQDLPLRTLYKVSRVLKKLDENLDFYNKRREELVVKYCVVRDGKYTARDECAEEFNEKFTELLNLEVEVDEKLPVVLDPSENITLSYNNLTSLKHIIEFKEE